MQLTKPFRTVTPTLDGYTFGPTERAGIRDYLAKLPHGKLPDRRDFRRFERDDAGRMKYWRAAIAEATAAVVARSSVAQ